MAHKFVLCVDFFSELETLVQKSELKNAFTGTETSFCIYAHVDFCAENILNFVCFEKILVIVVKN